jgi:hypothetical protein
MEAERSRVVARKLETSSGNTGANHPNSNGSAAEDPKDDTLKLVEADMEELWDRIGTLHG